MMWDTMKILLDSKHNDERLMILVNHLDDSHRAIKIARFENMWIVVVPQGAYEDIREHDAQGKFFRIVRRLIEEREDLIDNTDD